MAEKAIRFPARVLTQSGLKFRRRRPDRELTLSAHAPNRFGRFNTQPRVAVSGERVSAETKARMTSFTSSARSIQHR